MNYQSSIRKKKFLFLGIVMWFLPILLPAQTQFETLLETWRWTRFTTISGLPSNQVYDVVETSDGVIWAATKGGLARYDNFRWNLIDKSKGLPAKRPERLIAGFSGKLLLIISDTLYQGDQEGFVPVYPRFEDNKDDGAQSAVPMGDDEILIGATNSLYTYKDGILKVFPAPSKILTDRGLNLWMTKSKKIWLNTMDGIYQLDGKKWILKLPRKEFAFGLEALVEAETGTGVLAFVRPPPDQGLWEWEKSGIPKRSETERSALVQSVDIAPGGNVIAAYESGEIRVRQNGTWSSLYPLPSEMTRVLFLKFRSNGDLWVGTEDGLFLHKSSSTRWSRWSHPFADLKNSVHEIFQASNGAIWLGTLNGLEVHQPDGTIRFIEKINDVILHTVTAINEDSEHNIWVGSGSSFDGAFKWDGRSWSHVGASEGLRAPRVHKIRKDRQGRLWFLGLGIDYTSPKNQPGAFLYADKKFIPWGEKEGLPSGRVYCFAEDGEGAYWFGTMGGLSRWKNNTWTHWNEKKQLFTNRTFTLAVDHNNRVWFSDQHSGLGYIDQNDQVAYLRTSDGLINDEIWDIQADERGKLWISTRGGLCCYENGIWTRFDTNTGLSTLRLWEVLPLKDKVYVGSSGSGINILNLKEMGLPPSIEFTKPAIQNNEALLRWQAFPYFGEVVPQQVETRFRLDNGSWSHWNTTREVIFSDLEAGKHTFQVQAKGLFGNFNQSGWESSFIIEPAFYLRPLFLLPLGLLSLALVFTGMAFLDRKRKQDIALRESEGRYRKFFEDDLASDFLATPDGKLSACNPSFIKTFGFKSLDDAIGSELRSLFVSTASYDQILTNLKNHRELENHRADLLRNDGQKIHIIANIIGEFNPAGELHQIKGYFLDDTKRYQSDENLRKSETKYRTLFESANDAILIFEPTDGVILEVNNKACELYGFNKSELIGINLHDVLHDAGHGKKLIEETLLNGSTVNLEMVHARKDRTPIDLLLNATLIEYNGNIAIMSINRDITERKKAEQILEKERKLLRTLIEALPDEFSLKDTTGRFLIVNEGTIHALGAHSSDEVIGKTDFDFLKPDRAKDHFEEEQAVIRTGKPKLNNELIRFNEETGHIERCIISSKLPLSEQSGKVVGLLTINRDITERKHAEVALKESEERFRKIFEEGPIGMATFDLQYHFIDANSTLCAMLGYTETELVGLTLIEITHPDELEKDLHSVQRLLTGEIPFYKTEKRYLKKNKEPVWINLTASMVRDNAGKPAYGIAMVENITERKKAEETLRSLPKRIIEAQESERRRVSRDLHDSASQILASVKFRIQSLEEKIPPRNTTMRKEVANAKQLLDKVVSEIRRISHNLRPSELDDLGLAAALRTLTDEFTERTSIVIDCSLETLPKTLPSETELTIYRIIQEALTNVEKHSKATRVVLQLGEEDGFIKVKIHDNGKGLKPIAPVAERNKKSGMGLIDMRERLMFIKGTINIISGAKRGTEILIRIPLNGLHKEQE